MFKKAMLVLLAMLMVPNFASAYNYWSISATTSPVVSGAITPPAGANFVTSGSTTNVVTSGVTSADFSVAAAPAGYTLSYVLVDGVKTSPVGGVYTVQKGTKISHTLSAVYATQKYSITTSKTGNGVIDATVSVAAGSDKAINMTAGTGYKIGSVTKADGSAIDATQTGGDGVTTATYTFTGVQANKTILVNYIPAPAVTAKIATSAQTVQTGAALVIDGSISTSTVSANYAWAVSPAGATIVPAADGKTATFTASTGGNYVVTLTLTAAGATQSSASVAIAAASAAIAQSNACTICHASKDPAIVAAYSGSAHPTSGAAIVACQSCHTDGTNTMAVPTDKDTLCSTCHNATPAVTGLIQAQNWTKSLHNKDNNHFEQIYCSACHNSHSLVATATDDKTDSCAGCHTYRDAAHNYSIYTDATQTTFKAPHGGGKAAPASGAVNVGDSITQYLTNGAICTDCHGHNNAINAGFAAGGHGEVSSDPLNPFGHYDWSGKTNNGTRQNSNCDRCHTTSGFLKLLGQDAAMAARLAPQAGKPGNVLLCVTCHKTTEGELRTDAVPAGLTQPLSAGYFALFSSASPTAAGTQGQVAANKTKIQIQFPGLKNSSVCVPCHSGRSTAAVFTALIDQAKVVNKNYTTIQTSYYQHAKNIGQTFISQGAYDISGKLAAITANGPSGHIAVKNGATDSQGPCVGCHHSSAESHSLEVAPGPTCIAAACHATVPDVAAAKANFDAGVAALDALIRVKFAPLQTKVGGDLAEERAWVRFGRFGKADGTAASDVTAKAAYGAWYNWQILATYDNAAYVHNPRYARQILNDTLGFLQTATVKTSYGLADVNAAIAASGVAASTQTAATSFVVAPGCQGCHADKVTAFTTAGGYHATVKLYACANCHTELHMNTAAATQPTCRCHGDVAGTSEPVKTALNAAGAQCASCHGSTDVHTMKGADMTRKCVDCHAIAIQHPGNKVADNNGGVRAILPEFAKRSHHITGGTPQDEQCAVCHLEGKFDATSGKVIADSAYHMKDSKIYLRNADTDAAFAWSGTEHGNMDNFCFSCHDNNGATSAGIAAIMNGKNFGAPFTATNPFADTLTNGYDQVARAGVIDVKTAFTTSNASHHAVSGQRYQYRFSTRENADYWAAQNGKPAGFVPDSQIAEFHIGEASPNGGVIAAFDKTDLYANGINGAEKGGDATLFEAGKFVSTYTPLGAAETVADNSTLHCGDCHTVGQWKAQSSTSADGSLTPVAIGAHGSANDYLLRNSLGTDALHSSQTYVCFNCHKNPDVKAANDELWDELVADGEIAASVAKPTWKAGWNALHPNVLAGQVSGYAVAHSVSAMHAQCIADSSNQTGNSNTTVSRAFYSTGGGHKDRTLDFVPAPGATAAVPTAGAEGGNVTGIGCTNCHNSGLRQGWGGIHGGNNTYTDGLGRSQKSYRFMPGMGNYRYAPPGGWDGKDKSDSTLITQAGAGVGAGKPMGGCYTSNSTTENAGWSSCAHHGTSTAQTTAAGQAAGFRATYGGGTAATPTAAEPTVREATAGNTLVTRPLKY